jgi:uncharacterized protein (DUF2126 family)
MADRVPVHPTGTVGVFVAGVRYRAWQRRAAASTIPVHSAARVRHSGYLESTLDRRVRLHAAHPGGRNFEVFPVNAYEAESRRLARFFDIGHTGGAVNEPPDERDPDFPLTLDLRTPHRLS